MKFSIIVPIYNVEKYLEECLNSIVSQTQVDLELVLINDGSTDSSLSIAERYVMKYPFVKLINQSNKGLSASRNIGIQESTGDYLLFMDSDDYYSFDFLYEIQGIIETYNPDIIKGFYKRFYEKEQVYEVKSVPKSDIYNRILNSKEYLLETVNLSMYEVVACNAIYRRAFLIDNNLYFREGVTYEDHEFSFRCLLSGATYFFTDKIFYIYRQRGNSITTTPTCKSYIDICLNAISMYKLLENSGVKMDSLLNKYLEKVISMLVYMSISVFVRLSFKDMLYIYKNRNTDLYLRAYKHPFDTHQKWILKLFILSPLLSYYLFKLKRK